MSKQDLSSKKYNLGIFLLLVIVVFILTYVRVIQLAVFKTTNGVDLTQVSPTNEIESSVVATKRGTIYDQMAHPLALDTTSYSIYAVLRGDYSEPVDDIDKTAQILSQYIDLSRDDILEILKNTQATQVEFGPAGQNLSATTAQQLEAENLPGIYINRQTNRQYTTDYFSSHLLGYADLENGQLVGKLGVERDYNDILSDEQLTGKDVHLTLNSRYQNVLEDLMTDINQRYQPVELGAYLVENKTGRLLAASQRPTFNLNTREGIDQEWRHYLVENAFEPGSTIKILTTAIARDQGISTESERFQSGSIDIYDTKVYDYNLEGWGTITFDQGLIHSSNVGMVELINRVGVDTWTDKLNEFGFGQTTDSGLANENSGLIDFDSPVTATMSAFGQGMLASPIQLLEAYSTIGNHGQQIKLQYIESIDGEPVQSLPQVKGQPISQVAADHVLNTMVDVVEADGGTAFDFKSNTTSIAAKTGTAQIADPNGHGYLTGDNDYYFSVISFFPSQDPEYMLYLFMRQPQNPQGRRGSEILAELFHPFVDYIMIKN